MTGHNVIGQLLARGVNQVMHNPIFLACACDLAAVLVISGMTADLHICSSLSHGLVGRKANSDQNPCFASG
jgi:hypothetical protein